MHSLHEGEHAGQPLLSGYRDECYAIAVTYCALLAWSLNRRAPTSYEEESDCLLAWGVACRRHNSLRALCTQSHP